MTSLIYPSNCQVQFPSLPSPPAQNFQVRFTLKSPGLTYPSNCQVRFTHPLQNCQVQFTPQITKSDLPPPPNHQVQFTPQIAKSNLPPNYQVWFTPLPSPRNHKVWFTPQIGESNLTFPSNHNFWAHFSHSNIMLRFTKVFSAKDQ